MKIISNIILILFCLTQFAYSDDKVVFLDINYVLSNSNKGKLILSKLDEKNKLNLSELKSKEKTLKDLEIDLEKKKNIISEQELKNQINQLKSKIIEFRNERKKIANEFNSLKKKEISKLMKLINPIIANYVEKNSINLVLDKNKILIGKKSYDITNDILELVNKSIK